MRLLGEFRSEFLAARHAAGLSQMAVAQAGSMSRASIERLELGRLTSLSVVQAAELATIVGLDLVLRTYAGPSPVRDAGQLRLLHRLIVRLGPDWVWEFEVPLGVERDQRAWDARGVHRRTGVAVVIEAVTRVTDVQALLRRIALKRRDGGEPRVVMLLADTRTNSEALSLTGNLDPSFPIRTRGALRALRVGADPGGDCLVVL